MRRLEIIKQLFGFLWRRRKLWFYPLILLLVILGVIVVLGETSVLAPLVYPF